MQQIHLQGLGKRPAIPAGECKPGMFRLYNYGATGEIIDVEPLKGGKSVRLTTRENGKLYTTVKRKDTLIAVVPT